MGFKVEWDNAGERFYETGVSKGVLYPFNSTSKTYTPGVAWNGLTGVTENPTGAESNPVYADNIKYLNLISAEEYGGTIEALMYPDAFAECDGSVELTTGVKIGQQPRKKFGFSYQTIKGDDIDKDAHGYIIHIVYGATATPSQKQHQTVNETPNQTSLSWEFSTEPVKVTGKKDVASLEIDTTLLTANQKAAIEEVLYGKAAEGSTAAVEARLPLPDEILSIITSAPSNGGNTEDE